MKLALIPPTSMSQDIAKTDLHLILPEQIKQFPANFVQALQGYRVLDNGAAEGETASLNLLTRLSADFHEVVAPDKLNDTEMSVAGAKSMKDFNRFPGENKRLNFMAVVQGTTWHRVRECYRIIYDMPWIDVIALPRIMTWNFGEAARVNFLAELAQMNLLAKPIHCLGCNYNYAYEINLLAETELVRSMDTSLPYVFGWYRQTVHEKPAFTSRPEDYFNVTMDADQLEVTAYNVEQCLEWAAS